TSAWVGYNFSGGDRLAWELTPMLGGVLGDTTGIAPGYEGSLSFWKLRVYSEGEYVVDTRHSSGTFFYDWAQLTLHPVSWLKLGLAMQDTRAYHTDRDVQRGPLVGVSYKRLESTIYVFNPEESRPPLLVSLGLTFDP